jgi:exodeoxyribonuclease V alpha subunit
VLDNQRLYLRRYWQYQQVLNKHIHLRLQPVRDQLPASLQQTLQTLFKDNTEQPDWQKIACVLALRARFAIITGGPGTGKTTTLTKLLSLLIELAEQEQQRKLTILLAAPTGKAAARVSESIANALQDLPLAACIKQQIPKQASTLHRLLGSRPDSRRFKHDHHQPLLADIVIVDEASMIDLEMMASLLDALPDTAQLILLGDKDQLASVEAGSVMGDLCQGAEWAAYDADTLDWIAKHAQQQLPVTQNPGSAINQQTIMLRHSHRFGSDSGIGELARAVNAGDVVNAERILSASQSYADLQRIGLSSPSDSRLKQLMIANGDKPGYGDYVQLLQQPPKHPDECEQWALAVLLAFDRFQVLSALRGGDWGVAGLNQRIEHWLFPDKKPGLWYAGRPVMITRNDYNLGLMNGDIGMTLTDADQKLRVAFPSEAGSIRWVSPLRLPDVETAFAMTVHKSQGSEFQHVALVLPEVRSPVLTRELIYTGITRARKYFSLLETRSTVLAQAIENRRK